MLGSVEHLGARQRGCHLPAAASELLCREAVARAASLSLTSPCQPRAAPTSKAGHSQVALLSEERPVSSLTHWTSVSQGQGSRPITERHDGSHGVLPSPGGTACLGPPARLQQPGGRQTAAVGAIKPPRGSLRVCGDLKCPWKETAAVDPSTEWGCTRAGGCSGPWSRSPAARTEPPPFPVLVRSVRLSGTTRGRRSPPCPGTELKPYSHPDA